MKTKWITLLLMSFLTMLPVTGCADKDAINFQLLQGGKAIMTAMDDAEAKLREVKLDSGTLLFKDVTISASKGLFYNSYTVSINTNVAAEPADYELRVKMPGKVTQVLGGSADGNTVTFKIKNLSKEYRYAAYSDSNNTGTMIGILCVLSVAGGGYIFFMKRKQG